MKKRSNVQSHSGLSLWLTTLGASIALIACGPIEARRPEPSMDAGVCEAGQVSVCLGRCATVADPASVDPARRACDLDECKNTGAVQICPTNYTCTRRSDDPTSPKGECVASAQPFCDPTVPRGTGGNRCPDNLVCVPLGSAAEVGEHFVCAVFPRALERRDGSSLVPRGRCVAPRLDTEACDGEWDTAVATNGSPTREQAVCSPCADGLRCWQGRCRRGCAVDGSGAAVADFPRATPPAPLQLNASRCRSAPDTTSSYRCTFADRLTPLPEPAVLRNGLCERCSTSGSACPVNANVEVDGRFTSRVRTVSAGPAIITFTEVTQDASSTGLPTSPCCTTGEICAGPGGGLANRCCTGMGGSCTTAAQCCSARLTLGAINMVVAPNCGPTPLSAGANVCRPPEVCSMTSDCNQLFGRQDCFISGPIGLCGPCGSSGQACCPTGARCDAFSQCGSGQCTACGGQGEACCGGTSCRNGNACIAGTCQVPCGAPGQACCAGGGCTGLNTCDAPTNTCQPCGQMGLRCCATPAGPFCTAGLGCDPRGDAPACRPCGGSNQVCCSTASGLGCNDAALACAPGGTRVCEPCGGPNQLCCTSGPQCPRSGEGCGGDGRCGGACGGQGERCCVGQTSPCNPGFFCEGAVCAG